MEQTAQSRFSFPLAISKIFFACIMDTIPIVIARLGTSSIFAKKAGIRLYRAFVQVYNMGAFDEIFVRFVKADMTVKTYSQKL